MTLRYAVGACAVLALGACTSPGTPVAETSPSTAAAAPAPGSTPDRAFVVGKWGTDGDCSAAMDLRADGSTDGPFGNWTYTDGVISFADVPELKITVTVVDEATMNSTNDEGEAAVMTRCP